ncbi:acyl-CoA dehydrogenase family protein [Pedococcus sp. NPDC057267]|uniref:acyl-CoA dehydrogenase family protein n=1 Tax=Pedococcus sp. NPDC057267 TaxID=3346077 RepID=UPI00363E088A
MPSPTPLRPHPTATGGAAVVPVLLARAGAARDGADRGGDDGAAIAPEVGALLTRAGGAAGDVGQSLDLARGLGAVLPGPGEGRTGELWSVLATLGAVDLTTARVVEPHLDALAILRQAGVDRSAAPQDATWGVFAAEGPGLRLSATRGGDGTWRLEGVKPWCSLADRLSHAVVTAHTGPGSRRAFAVELRAPGVTGGGGTWASRGLRDVPSLATRFDGVPAVPVGEDDWYLTRPGFAWGGIGVAACWYGGAVGLARAMVAAARTRPPDQVALMHLGAVDGALHAARSSLLEAASLVDAGDAEGAQGALLALRVRGVVAEAVERVLAHAAHALGPGPLTGDEEHARRVADLQVYVRQHHAERDQAVLGKSLLDGGGAP